jgi:hypothetical protein
MNKHMKQHSQRLNIKTTRLASLTAIFHRKKQVPYKVGETPSSTMDVDNTINPPEQDSQAGGLETIPQGPATPYNNGDDDSDDDDDDDDDDEVDGSRDHDNGGGGGNGGSLMESDSDEFESDEEGVSRGDLYRADWGTLDFELKAAEAGESLSHASVEGWSTDPLNHSEVHSK